MHALNAPYLHIFISVQALTPKMNPRGGWVLFLMFWCLTTNEQPSHV